MRILVLGNINSKWVKEYIEFILLPLGHVVEVLGNEKKCKYGDFYLSHGVVIHNEKTAGKIVGKIPFVRVLSSVLRTVRGNQWNEYDVIVNMFVNHRDLWITRRVKSKNTKTIVYYTGSDMLRKSKSRIFMNRMIVRKPDVIVVGSSALAADFKQKYPKNTPVETIRFGISAFENIEKYKKNHPNARREYAFCIGYNGVRQHNHLDVLDLFDRLPEELKEKVYLVVPMTYGAAPDYTAEVKRKLDAVGIRYRQYTEFMDNDAMAEMWCGISYFINAQTTDSLSASVLEALDAGAVLLNASWLSYPEYREFGIKYLSFDNYEDLYGIITDILLGKKDCSDCVCSEMLNRHMSWLSAQNAWSELFCRFDRR